MLSVLRPMARGLAEPTVAAVLALAMAPALITLVRGGDDLTGATVAATVVVASVAAFAVEDLAAEVVAATPVTLARRRLLRLCLLAAVATLVWLVVALLAVVVAGDGGAPGVTGPFADGRLGDRLAEAAAVSGLAAGVAGALERRGGASPGPVGALVGAVGVLVVSSFAFRYPALPVVGDPAQSLRWWPLGFLGWAMAVRSSRDPLA